MEVGTIAMAAAGGALSGASAGLLLLVNGRIAGNSGIIAGLLERWTADTRWRLAWLSGLLFGGVVLLGVYPQALAPPPALAGWKVAAAGLLVGFGTRLGNGCTAGHGVCGVGRLSRRSLVATTTFFFTAAMTVLLLRGLGALT